MLRTLSKKIFFGSKLKQAGTPAADVLPKFVTNRLEWWIPVLTPNLTAEKFFHTQLDNDKNVEVGFMKHRMARTTFNNEEFTWSIAEVRKHVRFVFIAFKTDNHDAKKNNNSFTLKNIKKVQVAVNGENYPEINLDSANGDVGEVILNFIKACDSFGNECQMNIKETVDFYPVLCFNTTSQPETLEGNSVSITINKDGADQITAYMHYCLRKVI